MKWSVDARKELGFIEVAFQGKLDVDHGIEALRAIWEEQEATQLSKVLWNLGDASAAAVTPGRVRKLARVVAEERPVLPPARAAFIAGGNLQYGFARMLIALMPRDSVTLKVFRDSKSAVNWLTK